MAAIRCEVCGATQSLPSLEPRRRALCFRCKSEVARGPTLSLDAPLALCLAALIFWALANSIPFITLEYGGIIQTNRVFTGVTALWMDHQYFLSVLVGMTSIAIPGLQLSLACGLMLALRRGVSGGRLRPLSRLLAFIAPGSMPGVYLVGAFVAAVKLSQLATLTPGPGLYCFGAFALLWVIGLGSLDLEGVIEDFRPRRSGR